MHPAEMRAALYLGPEQIELRRVPIPEPKAGEILVKVRAATTCGTDVKTFRRGHPKFPPPLIFGHEFAGDVAALGAGVERFKPGMRVTANVFAECGGCFYCQHGQGNLCDNLEYNFGAFAEYMVIPGSIARLNTFEIPAEIPYAEAAILEPLVSVVHAQRLVQIQPGESVAILGAGGPIGMLHLQMAALAGAAEIIAVEKSPLRLAAVGQLGANHLLDPGELDLVETIRQLTGGRGADVVIECAGTKATWEASMQAARKGGRVLWFGGLPAGTRVELDATHLHYNAIVLYNTHGGTAQDAREAMALIASRTLNLQPLLSGFLPLEQVELALRKMMAGEVIKIVIDPQLEADISC